MDNIKVALPRSKKHISLAVALRHVASIPKATKPHVTAYKERELARWYTRKQKRHYTTGDMARAYKAWKLSQWAGSVTRLARELEAKPQPLATLKREILRENRHIWQTRDYRPYASLVRMRSICERQYVILEAQCCAVIDTTGDRYTTYTAELWVPLAQYWQFHLSEEYQQWLRA